MGGLFKQHLTHRLPPYAGLGASCPTAETLATSIAAFANCLLLAYYLRRRLGHLDGRRILRSSAKFAAASLVMGVAVAAGYSYSTSFFDAALLTHRLLQVGGLIALGGAVYLSAAALLKTEELARVVRRVVARPLPGGAGGWK